MGLAFNLDVTDYPWFSNLDAWLDFAGASAGTLTDINAGGERFHGYAYSAGPVDTGPDTDQGVCITPTGEYIIRDGIYINGCWVLVGSYRAYISTNDAGTGPTLTGYAWDGFILIHRAYSNIDRPAGEITTANIPDPSMYSFIPMRMPLEVLAAQADWDDPDVGLYAVDVVAQNGEANDILNTQSGIGFWVTGHSNIDPTKYPALLGLTAPPTGLTTSAHISQWFLDADNISTRTGANQPINYSLSNLGSAVFSLHGEYLTPSAGALSGNYPRAFDLATYVAVTTDAINGVAPPDYTLINFDNGMLPDGTGGGAPGPDRNAVNRGYYLMKAYGVSGYGSDNPAVLNRGMAYITGSLGLVDVGGTTITETCPYVVSSIISGNLSIGDTATYYFNLSPAHACPFQAYADPYRMIWYNEITRGSAPGTAPYYDLLGADAVWVNPPAEDIDPQFAAVQITPVLVGVNNIDVVGVDSAAVYTLYSVTGSGDIPVAFVWQVRDGGFELDTTPTILCPTKWNCRGIQHSTFTVEEEKIGFGAGYNLLGTTSPVQLWDKDHDEYVGWVGNWQRLPPTANNSGTPSRRGFGIFGSYSGATGTGAAAWIYDSTATSGTATATGFDCTSILSSIGTEIAADVLSGTAADYSIISCQWDNDRDQWLMIGSDTTNGVSILSADSIWSTFIDQTSNFLGYPAASTSALYSPISMSNSLDGIVIFGDTSTSTAASINGTRSTAPTGFVNRNLINTLGTYIFNYDLGSTLPAVRIDGSTGRTAKVWVDYILFDGTDSVIAEQLRDWGIAVSVENVEWFKARLLNQGDVKASAEEIETWVESQAQEYREMLRYKERQGRLRRRKKQVSGYMEEIEESFGPMTIDNEQLADWVPKGASARLRARESGGALQTPPPVSVEAQIERDVRVGGTPSGSEVPGEQVAEDPATAAGSELNTLAKGDLDKKNPGESRDPDEHLDEDY